MPVPTALGHWDVYELLHRLREGEEDPLGASILPTLHAGHVSDVWFAVGGDSRSHAGGSDHFLRGCLETMDAAVTELEANPDVVIVRSQADLANAHDREAGQTRPRADSRSNGKAPTPIRFLLVLEGGRPFEGSLSILRQYHRLGIRCLLPTWNGRNELGDGVGEGAHAGGLSKFGHAVVREMRRLGMVLDLSHLAEQGFYQAIDSYQGIVVATHSNAKALCDHPRNITDDQIRAVANTNGVVGIAFMPAFLSHDTPSVDTVVDHIQHVADLVGTDHVAIGPDFSYGPVAAAHKTQRRYEGVRVNLDVPYPIPSAAELPHLEDALRKRGFDEDDLGRILGTNLTRVLERVLPVSDSTLGAPGS